MQDNQNTSIVAIIAGILLLLAGGLGWFFWQKSNDLRAENERRRQEITTLLKEKDQLVYSLDSLSNTYSSLRVEYENLEGRVASSAAIVEEKERAIAQLRTASSDEVDMLRKQVKELRDTKAEMSTLVEALQAENAALKGEISTLKGQNEQLSNDKADLADKVTGLTTALEDQIRKAHAAAFKATAFHIEPTRSNDKLTTRARRTREVTVKFEIADVPPTYQGEHQLYLVISDEKGNPIPTNNPIKAKVATPTGQIEILAQQSRAVNLGTGVWRSSFTYTLDERLKSGNYVIAIYSEVGLLGVTSFRLT